MRNHQVMQGQVLRSTPWGLVVDVGVGEAFVDNTKIPLWYADSQDKMAGGEVTVVVLDDTRNPPRASMLDVDIKLGMQIAVDQGGE